MKPRFLVGVAALIVVVAALIAAVYFGDRPRAGKDRQVVYRIGADITLTGRFAYFGGQLQKGLLLAQDEAKNSNPRVEFLFEDNQHEAKRAVAIFERFAAVDNVSAVISLYSPMSLAVRDLAARYNIPLITTYTTANDMTAGSQWVFRDFPSMQDQAPAMAEFGFSDLGLRRAMCIGFNTDFGTEGCELFRGTFTRLGGEMVAEPELMEMGQQDVRDSIVRSLSSSPDGVFLVLSAQTLAESVKKLREQGFRGAILGVIMFDSPEVWKAAGQAAEGAYFPSVTFDLRGSALGRGFSEAYRARFSEEPDYVAVYGYTIGKYLIEAVASSKGDRNKIRTTLSALDLRTIRGQVVVNARREISSPLAIYTRREENVEFVKAIP